MVPKNTAGAGNLEGQPIKNQGIRCPDSYPNPSTLPMPFSMSPTWRTLCPFTMNRRDAFSAIGLSTWVAAAKWSSTFGDQICLVPWWFAFDHVSVDDEPERVVANDGSKTAAAPATGPRAMPGTDSAG